MSVKTHVKDFHVYQYAKHQLHNSIISWDITKTLHTCYFEYFRHAWPHPSKLIASIYRNLWCSLHKISTSSLTSYLRYCKDFANFGQAWPCLLRLMESNYRTVCCLCACKKSTSYLPCFLRYCKGITNWLFWVLWACLQSFTKDLRQTQVFMWNSALHEKFNFSFSGDFY